MIKILAVGNSFSQDACAYLHQIAASGGVESKVVNLYIGGCSLERHIKNTRAGDDEELYSYELNGCTTEGHMVSILDGVLDDEWDFVTMQQASIDSGFPATYHPYLEELSAYVKKYAPNARQVIHETWAYEQTLRSPSSKRYGYSQKMMYASVTAAYHEAADFLGVDMIRSGELVQALRSDPCFDITGGGMPITRDGYHVSIPYGRYALGALWFEKLMGGDIFKTSFIPEGADAYVINRIKKYVKEFAK